MTAAFDFGDARRNGVYCVDEATLNSLADAATAGGQLVRRVDLARCHGKDDLMQRMAAALGFPASFGANWDALADCLGDLEWLPAARGHVWLLDHAGDLRDASASDFATLCGVLQDACARWKVRNTSCFAFIAWRAPASNVPTRVADVCLTGQARKP